MKKVFFRFLSIVILSAVLISLSCGKKEPAAGWKGFKELMPRNTFLYLEFRDWVYLRDKTPALDFLETARELGLGPRIRELLKSREEIDSKTRRAGREIETLREKMSFWEVFGADAALVGFAWDKGVKPTLAFLCRLPEGKGEYYEARFKELIGLSGLAGKQLVETTETFLGETLTSVSSPEIRVESKPTWSRVGDVFILATRREGARELLSRLKGMKAEDSLEKNERFQKTLAGMDVDARGLFFLDVDAAVTLARRLYGNRKEEIVRRLREVQAKGGEELNRADLSRARYYLKGLLKLAGSFDAVGGEFDFTEDGYRARVRYYLDEIKGSKSLLSLIRTPPRDWRVLDYIPAKVAGVEVGYWNLAKVYRAVLSFITANPDHGKLAAGVWDEILKKADFDPEEDIFSWLGEEYAFSTITLARTMIDTGSFALLVEVKSEEKMEAAVARLLAFGEAQWGSPLNIVEEEYDGVKMKVVYLPIPLLPLTPTLGKVGDFLVLASRKETFREIVDTRAKKEKSIRKAPDFIRMRERIADRGTKMTFSRLEERTEAMISLIRNSSAFIAMAAAADAAQSDGGPPPPDLAGLLNDIARVMEDLKVFKTWGKSTSFSDGYLEFREFIEIKDDRTPQP